VITATGHHLGAFGEDQVTLVESDTGVHVDKNMTGRLASPSTIDLRDYQQEAARVLDTKKPRTGRGFVGRRKP
jgi:hypothetical protein